MRPKGASAILQFRRSSNTPYLPIPAEFGNRTTTKKSKDKTADGGNGIYVNDQFDRIMVS